MTCPEKTFFMMNLTDNLIRQNYIDFFTVILICQCTYCYFFKLVEYILRNTDNRKYLIEALFVHVTNVVVLCVTHTHNLWIVLFVFCFFFTLYISDLPVYFQMFSLSQEIWKGLDFRFHKDKQILCGKEEIILEPKLKSHDFKRNILLVEML